MDWKPGSISPKWIALAALLVVLAQVAVFGLLATGRLHGLRHNLAPQAMLAGWMVLAVLACYFLRYHSERIWPAPAWFSIVALTLLSALCSVIYLWSLRPLLSLNNDLACWSEPMFLVDIVKWRAGAHIYLPPDDSNSGPYMFGAPALTYLLAKLSGHAASIPAYRWIQQLYLALGALLAAASAWKILRLTIPERMNRIPRIWLGFFFFAAFLFTGNNQTGAFNVYLHNDPLGILASMICFYALLCFAVSEKPAFLWLMAALPALAFMVKQYLAIWAAVYVIYMWLDGRWPLRRVLGFGVATFAILGGVVAAGLAMWGANFRYWVFTIMSSHVVSFDRISARYSEAAAYLLPGLLAILVFARADGFRRFLGLWTGWLMMVFAGLYTSGVAYSPSHLGPASMAGLCLFFAALAAVWPDAADKSSSPAVQWLQVSVGVLAVLTWFADYGFTRARDFQVSRDMTRYTSAIEKEFDGLPAERVLLDMGDWIYLKKNVVQKDRLPILVTHRALSYSGAFRERIARQDYARILVHIHPDGKNTLYDIADNRGISEALRKNYREVRRIAGVSGMEQWRYASIMLSDVLVLEPVLREK